MTHNPLLQVEVLLFLSISYSFSLITLKDNNFWVNSELKISFLRTSNRVREWPPATGPSLQSIGCFNNKLHWFASITTQVTYFLTALYIYKNKLNHVSDPRYHLGSMVQVIDLESQSCLGHRSQHGESDCDKFGGFRSYFVGRFLHS